MTAVPRERIEMRVDPETKTLAERASAAMGCASLTEFMVRLIREHAPEILQHETSIQLANTQFDAFIAACSDPQRQPSARVLDAAKRLDEEGF